MAAADAYQTRLRPAEVLAVLTESDALPEPLDIAELDRRLEMLCEWGNLYHERDDALTNSLAEFEGRGYVYYLTPGGEQFLDWDCQVVCVSAAAGGDGRVVSC